MKTKLEGFVTEVNKDEATVRLSEHSECAQCGSCGGKDASLLQARNPLHAKPGQQVIVEIEDQNIVKSAFIIFVLPLLSLSGGAFLGYLLSRLTGGNELVLSSSAAVFALGITLFFIRSYDKKIRDTQSQPVILAIKN